MELWNLLNLQTQFRQPELQPHPLTRQLRSLALKPPLASQTAERERELLVHSAALWFTRNKMDGSFSLNGEDLGSIPWSELIKAGLICNCLAWFHTTGQSKVGEVHQRSSSATYVHKKNKNKFTLLCAQRENNCSLILFPPNDTTQAWGLGNRIYLAKLSFTTNLTWSRFVKHLLSISKLVPWYPSVFK